MDTQPPDLGGYRSTGGEGIRKLMASKAVMKSRGVKRMFIRLNYHIRLSFPDNIFHPKTLNLLKPSMNLSLRPRFPFVLLVILLFPGFADAQFAPKREFRGAWIATVGNVDWPSKPGLSADLQKQEFIRLLDSLQRAGINAVIVQIRPAADAFYISSYEPWSFWLTGKQGLPPYPYYDPLQFMIREAHLRGMEFHAWFNPYRAVFNTAGYRLAPDQVTLLHPQWFVNYGDEKYFNPGIPEVWTWLKDVVSDVVSRYDIDGVHFDDYFYPYHIKDREFPDYRTWQIYGHGLSLEDWRRHNVDTLIQIVSQAIKKIKPWVKFGISPFGVWRNLDRDPEGSDTRAGQTDYDDLYADVLLWLKKGWIDYVAPQLYWEFGNRAAPYGTLLDWWAHHSYGRALYIGQGLYRVGSNDAWRNPGELPAQIRANRDYPEVNGSIFYSARYFLSNPLGICDSLREDYYRYPALVPVMPWLDSIPPPAPRITTALFDSSGLRIDWEQPDTSSHPAAFVIYRFTTGMDCNLDDPSHMLAILNQPGQDSFLDSTCHQGTACYYFITALDRLHNESQTSNRLQISWDSSGCVLAY